MPGRIIPLVTNEIYHIFNKGIECRPAFTDKNEYQRALSLLNYYQFEEPPMRFSYYLNLSKNDQEYLAKEQFSKGKKLIKIIAFCLMSNHFHILASQEKEVGISNFMSVFLNSYTRYFNTKHGRLGSLFLNQFKAVRIENENQLLHVSRYIHLNPYTSSLVKDYESLLKFPWSSLREYIGISERKRCEPEIILSQFQKASEYKKFVLDQAEYQKELGQIKHLIIE